MFNIFKSDEEIREIELRQIREKKIGFDRQIAEIKRDISLKEKECDRYLQMCINARRSGKTKIATEYYLSYQVSKDILNDLLKQQTNLLSLSSNIDKALISTKSQDAVKAGRDLYSQILDRSRFNIDETDHTLDEISDYESLTQEHQSAFNTPMTQVLLKSGLQEEDEILHAIDQEISTRSNPAISISSNSSLGPNAPMIEEDTFKFPSVPISQIPSSSYTTVVCSDIDTQRKSRVRM